MGKKTNFIITKDEETANKLIAEGFKLLTESNGTYTFANTQSENMDFNANKNLVFTNMLSF